MPISRKEQAGIQRQNSVPTAPVVFGFLKTRVLFFLVISVLQPRLNTMIEWYLYPTTDLYCS